MSDLKERIKDGLMRPNLASLATIKGEIPWTRYVVIVGDEGLTLRCATFLGARKVSQIAANPEVHLTCGVATMLDMKPYYQIQARAEVVTDAETKTALWNPMLEQIFSGPDNPDYAVVVMKPYRIELYSPPEKEPEVLELD